MEPRTPERLVDVDVPEAGDGALVEQGRLERRPPALEPLAEAAAVNAGPSGSRPETRVEVGVESPGSSSSQVPKRRTSR